jgi:hypothetical protein
LYKSQSIKLKKRDKTDQTASQELATGTYKQTKEPRETSTKVLHTEINPASDLVHDLARI